MLTATAAGLIAGGALLFLLTLLAPVDVAADRAEYERTSRNSGDMTLLSGASTLVGALLLLIDSRWLDALGGIGATAIAAYAVQVTRTHLAWTALRSQVEVELASTGRVTVWTAARVGLVSAPAAVAPSASHMIPLDNPSGKRTAERVAERARWSWALCHPLGGHV